MGEWQRAIVTPLTPFSVPDHVESYVAILASIEEKECPPLRTRQLQYTLGLGLEILPR